MSGRDSFKRLSTNHFLDKSLIISIMIKLVNNYHLTDYFTISLDFGTHTEEQYA